eukprot:11350192-Prorocentrum_lima.AAC.1
MSKPTLDETKRLEQHYKRGHVPKRKDCPVAERYGTLHVDLTGLRADGSTRRTSPYKVGPLRGAKYQAAYNLT